jgi:uncharacterized membrane protein
MGLASVNGLLLVLGCLLLARFYGWKWLKQSFRNRGKSV